jgi:ribosomal-protein-alanine N-acetyltransferase
VSQALESRPTLITGRLVLRPFGLQDAPHVQRLAGAREVADTTLNIPHPYEDGMAEAWIQSHAEAFASRKEVIFAVVRRQGMILVGAIGLRLALPHGRAEMGYWIGVPYWNQGYCTEAAESVLRHGFEDLGLHRIHASHLTRNPGSGRVMQKIGMTYEGSLRGHVLKGGVYEDLESYGLLAAEWRARR